MKAKILEMIRKLPPPGWVRVLVDGQVRYMTPLAAQVMRNHLTGGMHRNISIEHGITLASAVF